MLTTSRQLSASGRGRGLAFRSQCLGAAAAHVVSAPISDTVSSINSGSTVDSITRGQTQRQNQWGRRSLRTCSVSRSAYAATAQQPQRRLILVDAQALMYKYAHGYGPGLLTSSTGEDTSIAYGFLRTLLALLELQPGPTHMAVVFDAPGKNFRHELYPDYKAHRPPQPPGIKAAMLRLRELLDAMRVPVMSVPGIEADDVIAMLAIRGIRENFAVVIASPDKDFFQLLQPNLLLLRPVRKGDRDSKQVVNNEFIAYNDATFRQEKGLEPSQWAEVLAIMGDSADNIPGVAGIGEKTAIKLLQQFGSLENIIANAEQIKGKVAKNALTTEEGIAAARLGLELVTVLTEPRVPAVRIPMSDIAMHIPTPQQQQHALSILASMDFRKHSERLQGIWSQAVAGQQASAV